MSAPIPIDRRAPRASVVIPTYGRGERLRVLLDDLVAQREPEGGFEVVVVDDGSPEPVSSRLSALAPPWPLRVVRRANGGPGAARHEGATLARGSILIFVDDDMRVGPGFVEAHVRAHEAAERTVVLGRILPAPELRSMPLFERFHAEMLERQVARVRSGAATLRGPDVCTGNVSMRRDDYAAVGGFDLTLPRSEDAELGLRLEAAGASFVFDESAWSVHGSDHASLDRWMERARLYGRAEVRIAHRHRDALHASPWRFLGQVSRVSRPLLVAAAAAPRLGGALAHSAMRAAALADRAGLDRIGVAGTTLAYGLQYFRGVREEVGSLPAAVLDAAAFGVRARRASGGGGLASATSSFVEAVREDHATLRRYGAKYNARGDEPVDLTRDAVQRIGFQMMIAYRAMRWAREASIPLAPKLLSRLIRHAYGSDVHWDASLAPGVMLVHGMGMAVSHAARVGPGCILFQHVTLGEGIDPDTREIGGPTLERDVHVGPGVTILGPVTIGAGTKIKAGAVVTTSVPPGSLVEPAPVEIRARVRPRGEIPPARASRRGG